MLSEIIQLVYAGGEENIEKMVVAANEGLERAFPGSKPVTAKDFKSAESFVGGPRVAYFGRSTDDEKISIEVEQRVDGTSGALTVWRNDDRRDVEAAPVLRGLGLANYPVNHWTKSGLYIPRPSKPGERGNFFKVRDGFRYEESGAENLSLWINDDEKVFFVEHSDSARRKVYGPITGLPTDVLEPIENSDPK